MDYLYQLRTRNTRTILPNILKEILVRILLLSGLTLMHLKYQPQARYIIEEEILTEYKKPRRDSFIPPWIMITVTIFIPFFIICAPMILNKNYAETAQGLLGWSLSILLNAIFTEFLKLVVRRPRPDFYYRCYPNGPDTSQLRIPHLRDIIDGRKSFPSGHSSFAFCSLGFLSLWMKDVISSRDFINNLLCFLPLLLATFIGASRCYDNHHHWQDVLAGAVLGFSISYVFYKFYCRPPNY